MSESITVPVAREQGFTDADIQLLREAGLLREDAKGEPWRPQTLEDVDWVCWRARQLDAEIAAIQARAAAQVERLGKERAAFLARFGEDCRQIATAHLPRKADGSYRRKSLDLLRTKVGIRSVAGGPRVTDEAALAAHLFDLWAGAKLDPELAEAVKVVRTLTGEEAIRERFIQPEGCKVAILATPVKCYVNALPAVPDPETGELLPDTLPGVEIVPAEERFYFE
jgi:hypothetical protein